jgi:hypothetical protein
VICPGAPASGGAPGWQLGRRTRQRPVLLVARTLARVDRAAKRRGVSRSAWVAFTLSKALDDDEQA